jgi:hypothetical protein
MAHGTPLDLNAEGGSAEQTGPHLLDAGISSTHHIARFWGLGDQAAGTTQAWLRRLLLPRLAQDARAGKMQAAVPAFEFEGIIRKALRSVGLTRS